MTESPILPGSRSILLAFPFRPFFLLTALYAVLLVAAWAGVLFGGLTPKFGVSVLQWHSHEMLYGMVPAAIAGFLLTAICNWTGAPPLQGFRLLALVLLWVAGRLAVWASGILPLWLVAGIDLAFLPVIAIYAARILIRHGNYRNLMLAAMLTALALGNLVMHLEFAGIVSPSGRAGELIGMNLIAVIMLVVGGRITPAFTANWLRMSGRNPESVRRSEKLDTLAMVSALLMIPADLVTALPWLSPVVALLAALINGWRIARWSGWQARSEPLVWILHLGLAWVVVALLLKAATPVVGLNATAWMHALGVGGMGTLILGVMTRVSLGHTGRPMRLPKGASVIYFAITLAVVARLAAALNLADYRFAIITATIGWITAFALFLVLYWPILSSARVDGRPG
jgi:uncharacterized protein involved in response to NO